RPRGTDDARATGQRARRDALHVATDDQLAGRSDRAAHRAVDGVPGSARRAAGVGALRRPGQLHRAEDAARMSAESARLPSAPTVVPEIPALPSPPSRRRTLLRLHAHVYERLQHARMLEAEPPERYGFNLRVASWLFTFTGLLYRWYYRTQL